MPTATNSSRYRPPVALSVAYFGTYDPAYPRNRVLIEGLRAAGATVTEYDAPLPAELTAARLASVAGAGELAARARRAHLRLLRMHPDWVPADVVVVGYPGHLVVPFGWALARIRRARLVFDPLVSLHDTFVGDRRLVGGAGLAARAASAADRLAFTLADLVLADTAAHARFYARRLRRAGATARGGAGRGAAGGRGHRQRPRPRRPTSRWSCSSTASGARCTAPVSWSAPPSCCATSRSASCSPVRGSSRPSCARASAAPVSRTSSGRACSPPTSCARARWRRTSASACSARPRRRPASCPTRSTTRSPPVGRS